MNARTRDGRPACEHCRAPVIWAWRVAKPGTKEETNPKPTPLDAEPDPVMGLNTLYAEPASRRWPQGRMVTGELRRGAQADAYRASGGKTYTRHYQTCPKKDQWGKAGRRYGSRDINK